MLTNEYCEACKPDSAKLSDTEIDELLTQLDNWEIHTYDGEKHLVHRYTFDDFKNALQFTIQIGDLAEEIDHHPTLITTWGKVTIHWWTHAIGGLHRNDFIMAAKTDQLFKQLTATEPENH